ncbi:hypothetical protein JCM10207_008183 [Rhodosporidiobolus poonsookiae]
MEPDTPKPKIQIDCAYNLVVTVDFHADLTKPETVDIPLELPFCGEWSLEGCNHKGNPTLGVTHRLIAAGRLGEVVKVRLSLFWMEGGIERLIRKASWGRAPLPKKDDNGETYMAKVMSSLRLEQASTASNGKYDPSTHRDYRVVLHVDSDSPVASHKTEEKLDLAKRLSALSFEHIPHTLRLVFTTPNGSEAELWASGKLLLSKLPFFKDLLASDFEEATVRCSKRARTSGAQPVDLPDDQTSFDDSDVETDGVLFTVKPPKLSDSSEAADVPFHEISIKYTAFSTYHALLVYLQTGMIRFAPLRSASSPSNPSSFTTRDDWLAESACKTPTLPLPVSPKSLYRLIDLLRLPDSDPLYDLCLRAFADSLTHHGAANELFSKTSVCFDKLRRVALEHVVEHYDEVTATPSWTDKLNQVTRGELPEAAPVLVELMRTWDARLKKG